MHYAGVLDELEDQPHTPAAEAINAARKQLKCAQFVRTAELDETTPPAESPTNERVGDTGLEPVTSALSRRNHLGKPRQAPATKGMIWRGDAVTRLPTSSDGNPSVPSEGCDRIATAV